MIIPSSGGVRLGCSLVMLVSSYDHTIIWRGQARLFTSKVGIKVADVSFILDLRHEGSRDLKSGGN